MLEILVPCIALAIGLLAGCSLRGAARSRPKVVPTADPRSQELLEQLRDLTRSMAADVGQRQELMDQLNDELQLSGDQQPTEVVRVVGKLVRTNERMQQQLQLAEQKLKKQERQIVTHATAARTDPLTTLANRRAFDSTMADVHRAFVADQVPATVVLLDIDHFKSLNDTYGHQAGDEVLRVVGSLLKKEVPERNLLARYGGEEFAIVFPNARFEEVEEVADRARRAIGAHGFTYEGLELHVTASAGIAQLQARETVTAVLGRADEALYASKEAGRNCTHFHDGTGFVRLGGRPRARNGSVATTASSVATYNVGIASPEVFSSNVRRRLADLKSTGTPLCVIYLKIDDLDDVRDRFGAENGVAAHRAVTLMVKAAMRELDHAARYEGDGISLLLPGYTLRGAVNAAEKLCAAIAHCELPKRHGRRQFTVSIGVAEALAGESDRELLNRVRDSLTAARRHGRDCTYVHDGLNCHLVGAGRFSVGL